MTSHPFTLVTGATGAIGPSVVDALCKSGYRIRTLSLDPPPKGIWPDDIDVCIGDVTDPYTVQAAMTEVESVIHLAALLHIVNPPPALREKYERVNVEGTATVVKAAALSGVRRVVFFSTIAVYGNSACRILSEDTPPCPDTFYAQTKYAAEQIVLDAKRLDGQPIGTVLRLAAVYGARIKGNYRRLLQSLARDRFIPLGDGKNRRTLVYDKDIGKATALVLSHPLAAGQVYNVSDGHCHTMEEIINAMCRALGRPGPRFSLPIGPARFAARILENGTKMLGVKSSSFRTTINKYTEDMAVDGMRIQSHLGFVPHYDLDSGWRETVEDMRRMGDL
jgi:nucleoside-diphosphate-sugar epimerase